MIKPTLTTEEGMKCSEKEIGLKKWQVYEANSDSNVVQCNQLMMQKQREMNLNPATLGG